MPTSTRWCLTHWIWRVHGLPGSRGGGTSGGGPGSAPATFEDKLSLASKPLTQTLSCRDPRAPLQVASDYYRRLTEQVHHRTAAANATAPRLAYTALHGVGTPWLLRAFEAFGLPPPLLVEQQCSPDPDFSTGGWVGGQGRAGVRPWTIARDAEQRLIATTACQMPACLACNGCLPCLVDSPPLHPPNPLPPSLHPLQCPSPTPRKARAPGLWPGRPQRQAAPCWLSRTTPTPTAFAWRSGMHRQASWSAAEVQCP